ncbi:MAG: glycerophosphodiester phosphodiesterase [Rhodobacteraceae bacterium]|nr:glycerophosphodiester phosphodiesterase [Paracoccaceae bacterium]
MDSRPLIGFCAAISASLLSGLAAAGEPPLIIAHRGASGYLPEHTLEAYARAIELGADYIEPDLVITKDGILIARHENELSDTTDVANKFPERKTSKVIDGRKTEGWFSEDFTLAEIKTLRANERIPSRSHANDGKFEIPTFQEVLALAAQAGAKRGRPVGIYPETKHPSYFDQRGLPLEPRLLLALAEAGLNRADAPVFIQSFETANLKALKELTDIPLVQLFGAPGEQPYDEVRSGGHLTYGDLATDQGLASVAGYAAAVGPFKGYIVPISRDGAARPPTDFIARAHAAGLKVHPYTFRSDPGFLAAAYGGDPVSEYCLFFALGVDGLFTDYTDTALKARDESCPMAP